MLKNFGIYPCVLSLCGWLSLCGCLTPDGKRIVPPEHFLVYQPSGPHPDEWHPPGLDYEDVFFDTEDGVRLHGWYCSVENPTAYVVFAHGNAANVTFRYPDLLNFTKKLNATIFAFDYRGYGSSEGNPSERGLRADARAARKWLAEREQIGEDEIVLFGRSLGGGVMIDIASKDGAKGLILESTFVSLPAVANEHLPLSPGVLMVNRFNSLKKIPNYHGPLILAHGTDDQLIPFAQGEQLFAAANEPKQMITIPGAGHNWEATPEYLEQLRGFLNKLNPDKVSESETEE